MSSTPEFQQFRDTWIRVCVHGSRTRTVTAVVSLCASLIVSVYYIYNVQKMSIRKAPEIVRPVITERPQVVAEGATDPVVTAKGHPGKMTLARVAPKREQVVRDVPSQVQNQPIPFVPQPPAHIHKLFIEPIGNHLDESLRAEISKQLHNRITIVTERQDADATLKGLSGVRDGRDDPSGFHNNATGSLSLFDKPGKTILWSGVADDRAGEFAGTGHGGETKVAQRLVKGLKEYFKAD